MLLNSGKDIIARHCYRGTGWYTKASDDERTTAELMDMVREIGIWWNMHAGMDLRHAESDNGKERIKCYGAGDTV